MFKLLQRERQLLLSMLASRMVLSYNKCYSCWVLFWGFPILVNLDANKARKMSLRRMKATGSQRYFKKLPFWYSFTLCRAASGSKKWTWPPYAIMLVTAREITNSFHSQDFWTVLGKLKKSTLLCFPPAWNLWFHKWKGNKDFRIWLITACLLIIKQPSLGAFTILEFLKNLSSLP